ncbi:hypothetical protein Tco_1004278, partial [Tanacetum coccineum]
YIGCIRSVSGLNPFGDPNRRQSTRRKIEIKNLKSRYQETPSLIICKFPYEDIEKEKLRNRFPLKTLMEQNPLSYKCNKAAINQGEKYSCLDHGPQPGPFSRHIKDSLGTAPLTFFSSSVDKITKNPCKELVGKYNPTDPKKIPLEVLATQGKTSIFQFHFNTFENTTDLTLDEVFDIKTTAESISSIVEKTYKDKFTYIDNTY